MSIAGVIRVVLITDILGMALLALFYLRQRRMVWSAYCFWAAIALFLPVLGPFLVIAGRPGTRHPDPFPSVRLRRRVREYCQSLPLPRLRLDDDRMTSRRGRPRRVL